MHSAFFIYPRTRRFELPTPWSVAKCSIQLSYVRTIYIITFFLSKVKHNLLFFAGELSDSLIALLAEHVLDPAGIALRCLRSYTETGQELREEGMPLVDTLGMSQPLVCQIDKSCVSHRDLTVLAELFHSHTDAALLISELSRDIDGSDHRKLFRKQEYGL